MTVHADLPDDDVLRIEGVVAPDGSDACSRSPRWASSWPGPRRRAHFPAWTPRAGTTCAWRRRHPELSLTAGWMTQGVTLPGSYLTTTGLALPVLHPDHLVLLRVSAVD